MINPFVVKKWGALLLTGLVSTIFFFTGLVMYNFNYALAGMALGLGLSMLVGDKMLKTPFRDMLEGKGVLFFDFNSTGIIRPFVLRVKPPFINGIVDGEFRQDIFDRSMVYNLTPPQIAGTVQQGKGNDGEIRTAFVIGEEEYNKGRFGLNHYPVVLWNSSIKSVITKDWLSDMEKSTFAEHSILYLNRKVEELTTAMLNFGRYVVESTKPRFMQLPGGLFTIILIIGIVVILVLLAPAILPALKQAAGSAGLGAANAAGAVQTVTP